MSRCPGLIDCTTPSPGPTGLRPDEIARMNELIGQILGVTIMALFILLVIGISIAMLLVMRD